MTIAYLSIGSNLGDRLANLQQVSCCLSLVEDIKIVATSAFYETQPWGVENQPWFLNAIIEIDTSLSAQKLLFECQKIETKLGRNRINETRWGARLVDVDILFYGNEIIVNDNLKVPHKHLHERAFVLVPMLEIAPEFVHPVFEKSIEQLYDDLKNPEDVFLYGTI